MQTLLAREAKNSFGKLIDMSQAGAVAIEKHGRRVAVVISAMKYAKMDAVYEDAYWLAQAEAGIASGTLGPEESARLLAESVALKNSSTIFSPGGL
jgi:prevent-host-death family protein